MAAPSTRFLVGSVPLLLMGKTMRLREKATWITPLSQKPPNKTSWWLECVSVHAYSFCFTFIPLQYFPLHFSNYSHVWFFVTSWTARLLCPRDSAGKNTGVGCHALLQGIFPTQGSNLCLLRLLHWQAGSLPLAPPGKPQTATAFICGIKEM